MFPKNKRAFSYRLSAISILVAAFVLLLPSATPAAEPKLPKEPIVVNGDKVEYLPEKKIVTGTGNVSITYKDAVLTCDKITVTLDSKEAVAEGNVKITQKGSYMTGERIRYNFDTTVGTIEKGYVNAKPFYGKAERVDKKSEKEISLERGYVTTCELNHPHYRVQARQVEIYLEDKIIAKHILFIVGNVPIAYLPYYVQPLRDDTAHASVQVGRDSQWGYFALTSYKYFFSDIAKGRFLLDYRTEKGLAGGIDNYYDLKELGKGSARFYYTKENGNTAYKKVPWDDDVIAGKDEVARWRVQVRHKWDVTDDTVATFEYNEVRDDKVVKHYFYNEFEEAGRDPQNYLSFVTAKDNYITTFLVDKRMDKYFTKTEQLPSFTIDIPNYQFFKDIPVYYKASASGAYLNHTVEQSDPAVKDMNAERVDVTNQISYAAKAFGSLSLTPYVGTEQTYYSRNLWGDTNLVRGALMAGLESSIKFYRIYNVETNFLGMDIHKIRHVITPTANYQFIGPPTIAPENLVQFDSVDALTKSNHILFSIENKLQTKRPTGKDGTLTSVDLATFIVSSDYIFTLKEDNVAYKYQKFQTVDFQLELEPFSWLYSLSKMQIDTKRQCVLTASADLVARYQSDYSLGLGYRYENVESGKSNLLTTDLTIKISDGWRTLLEGWKVRSYTTFDIIKGAFREQEYTLYKDLHCWIAEFTYDYKKPDNSSTFWVVMRLKAFPNMPIGLRRTYYRPQFGSVGGRSNYGISTH